MALHGWIRALEWALRFRGVKRRELMLPEGRPISYLEAGRKGRGKTFVLVHGLGSSGIVWVRTLLLLGKRNHVVAPDLPGYGRSPMPEGRDHQNVAELAANVADFLRLGDFAPKVVLVGQSMGGWIATKTARVAPERIEQLVLVNTAGILYPGIEGLRTVLNLNSKKEVLAFWERMWYRVPRYYRPFWKEAAANLKTNVVLRFMDSLKEEHFINEDLPRLEMPVSIVWGRSDRFIPISSVDVLVEALRSTRVYWLAKCGHIPALEQPRRFATLLDALGRSDASQLPTAPSHAHRGDARRMVAYSLGRASAGDADDA